jgi:glycosyltransferase involved in cell wall biosynthesis
MKDISVIVTTYNRASLLPRCLGSIHPSKATTEIIVVDDCSSDGTEQVIKNLMHDDSRIRYIKTDKHSDTLDNTLDPTNVGIGISEGRYIVHCDDDDLLRPYRLLIPFLCLEHNPDIDFVYCDSLVLSPGKDRLLIQRDSSWEVDGSGGYIRRCEQTYRREVYDTVGPWKKSYISKVHGRCPGDFDFIQRVIKAGFKFYHIPIVLCDVIKREYEHYMDPYYTPVQITQEMVKNSKTNR